MLPVHVMLQGDVELVQEEEEHRDRGWFGWWLDGDTVRAVFEIRIIEYKSIKITVSQIRSIIIWTP